MAVSDIILSEGQVLVIPISSSSVMINFGTLNIGYGKVKLVYQLSGNYQVDQDIIYNTTNQIQVTFQSVSYYLINESSIKLIAPNA
jgi:hypothetical protein